MKASGKIKAKESRCQTTENDVLKPIYTYINNTLFFQAFWK